MAVTPFYSAEAFECRQPYSCQIVQVRTCQSQVERAYHADKARHILESGDVEEALNAASAIGDDRLQRSSQGTAVPDTFTHGTSEQRVRWFNNGLSTSDIKQCNTFSANQL